MTADARPLTDGMDTVNGTGMSWVLIDDLGVGPSLALKGVCDEDGDSSSLSQLVEEIQRSVLYVGSFYL